MSASNYPGKRLDPNVKAMLAFATVAVFAVLSVLGLIAWVNLRLDPDTASANISQTGSIAICAISALVAAVMTPVAIALRKAAERERRSELR